MKSLGILYRNTEKKILFCKFISILKYSILFYILIQQVLSVSLKKIALQSKTLATCLLYGILILKTLFIQWLRKKVTENCLYNNKSCILMENGKSVVTVLSSGRWKDDHDLPHLVVTYYLAIKNMVCVIWLY